MGYRHRRFGRGAHGSALEEGAWTAGPSRAQRKRESHEVLNLTSVFFISASGCVRTLTVMARIKQASPAQRRRAAASRRDAAVEQLGAITAAIAVTTIAAVGALGVYVAKVLPGHHAAPASGATSASNNPANAGAATGSGSSLNPPSSSPQGASLPAPVTSGSS